MPDYPRGALNPLTKRNTGSSSRIIEQTGSLRRRTSITRVTPGRPVSSALIQSENASPASPLRIRPKIKLEISHSKSTKSGNDKKPDIVSSKSSSLAVRSGNRNMSEKSFATMSAATKTMAGSHQGDPSKAVIKGKVPYPVTPVRKMSDEETLAARKKAKAALLMLTTNETSKTSKSKLENEGSPKLSTLRFSPEKLSKFKKLPLAAVAGPSNSLRKTAIENRATKTTETKEPKSSRSDIYAWRTSLPRKKVRVSSRSKLPSYRSLVPVPNPPQIPIREAEAHPEDEEVLPEDEQYHQDDDEAEIGVENHPPPIPVVNPSYMRDFSPYSENGSVASAVSVEPPTPHAPEAPAGPEPHTDTQSVLYGEQETISALRSQFFYALGIDEISLPSLSDYIQRVNFHAVLKDRLRDIKVREMYQRISVVKLLHHSSKYHGANENELGCVKGWLDDLSEELWMIECEKVPPSKIWFDQIFRWLWHRSGNDDTDSSIDPADEIYILCNTGPLRVLAAKKEHELFNLRDTGVELLRNGFRNKERKMLEYWARLRGLTNTPTSCGEDVIGIYMRRLTRWDGKELHETSIQRRRMWYFCLEHYAHWKEAVSFYALSLKMMNLLIIFHDLWGMHVDGMSNQEKKDFGVLHDNLYRFATVFLKPVEDGQDHIWQENECMYCFNKAAGVKISHDDRGRNLWMWLMQLAGIAGYGKYYSAVMKIMTDGKDPDYVNQLFETHFWSPRTCSLMTGLKRIKDSMKRHAGPGDRMGLGSKKPGIVGNGGMNNGLNGFKY